MGEGRIKKNVISADVPVIAGPRTYEEFRAQRGAPLCVARAEVPESGLPTPWWPDHKIVPGVRSGVELCDWLERRVDVERAPLGSASQTSIWSMRRSIEENLAEKTVALADYLFHLRRLEQPGWEGL